MRTRGGFRGGLWVLVAVIVVGVHNGVLADARGDLDDVTREFGNVTSHFNSARQKLDNYLAASVRLRSFDKDELDDLIRQICGSTSSGTVTIRRVLPRTCETRRSCAFKARTTTP